MLGRRNRKRATRYDKTRHHSRHLKLVLPTQGLIRLAIRYDKFAANFLSGVALANGVAFWI